MKFIKSYKKFSESIKIDLSFIEIDMNESLGLFYDTIMKSIGAQEVDFFNTFKVSKDDFADKLNLDLLTTNSDFIHQLTTGGYKKSNVTNSDDFETFLNKPCKFMLIHKSESTDLDNPVYILFQSWNDALSKWENVRSYEVKGNIKNFYDKLSSKVIEINDGGEKFIYQTTNGNEWLLQNVDKENDIYQKYFRKDDFEKLINDRKVTLDII